MYCLTQTQNQNKTRGGDDFWQGEVQRDILDPNLGFLFQKPIRNVLGVLENMLPKYSIS